MTSDARKLQEAEFHNRREQDRLQLSEEEFLCKYPNKRIYAIDRGSKGYLEQWLQRNCSGKVVLDYCCGTGLTTIKLAQMGAVAYGIDISESEIATAKETASDRGVAEATRFSVMDAEDMDFPDGTFDIIVCSGVLHHLDLNAAYPELARVLKPSGQVIAVEALGYNPLINLYRKLTPHLRTAWEIDHILTKAQVREGLGHFGEVEISYFHLFTILAVPFQRYRFFDGLLSLLETIDSVVLKIPGVRLMAWQMIFVFSKPK